MPGHPPVSCKQRQPLRCSAPEDMFVRDVFPVCLTTAKPAAIENAVVFIEMSRNNVISLKPNCNDFFYYLLSIRDNITCSVDIIYGVFWHILILF